MRVLYDLLEKCPDEAIPPALPRLAFLPPALAKNVARDVASLDALIVHQEWKAAAVLAGSIVEAILIGRLQMAFSSEAAQLQYAAAKKWFDRATKKNQNPRPLPIEHWGLENLITVALEMSVLDAGPEEHACRAAQKYRNLIHPGAERLTLPADEGAALSAVGAVKRLLTKFS